MKIIGLKSFLLILVFSGLVLPRSHAAQSKPSRFFGWGSNSAEAKPAPVAVDPAVSNLQDSFARVATALKPAVVSILATHVEKVPLAPPMEFFFGDPFEQFFQEDQAPAPRRQMPGPRSVERRSQGLGSGVVVDKRGYILTNEHVVRGAQELTVMFSESEEKFSGKVVGADPRSDLAVIKITAKKPFPFAVLGDSDKVRVGDWAVAVGSPFGLGQTVTVGVISALHQSLRIEGASYHNLLQTDAAINRGNSGGPLANIQGEVIGINSAIYAPTGVFAGIGFAIPANRVKDIMDQLISKGRVVRGWVGVEIVGVNEVVARQFGLSAAQGVLVNQVVSGSPAEKGGVRRGDVLTEVNGVSIKKPDDLADFVGGLPPKSKLTLRVIRDQKPLTLSLVTIEMPPEVSLDESPSPAPSSVDEQDTAEWSGARLEGISETWTQRLNLPRGQTGVVVTAVVQESLADRAGLEQGDLVVSVNRRPVTSAKQFVELMKKQPPQQGFFFDVFRQGRWIYLSFQE